MIWIEIRDVSDVNNLLQESLSNPEKLFVIFKHSTRCSTSRMAKNLFESEWVVSEPVYLVNVVESRAVSNAVSGLFHVVHESPQVVAICNGKSIYDNSHSGIEAGEVINLLSSKPSR